MSEKCRTSCPVLCALARAEDFQGEQADLIEADVKNHPERQLVLSGMWRHLEKQTGELAEDVEAQCHDGEPTIQGLIRKRTTCSAVVDPKTALFYDETTIPFGDSYVPKPVLLREDAQELSGAGELA